MYTIFEEDNGPALGVTLQYQRFQTIRKKTNNKWCSYDSNFMELTLMIGVTGQQRRPQRMPREKKCYNYALPAAFPIQPTLFNSLWAIMLLWSNNSFSCFCKHVRSPGSLISYQTTFVNSIMALIWSSLSVSFSRGRWFSRFSGMLCPARRRAFNVNPAHLLSKIDQISLGEMVKKKNFHRWELTVSGGVDGPAPAPVMWKGHSWWSWRFCLLAQGLGVTEIHTQKASSTWWWKLARILPFSCL